MKIISTSKQTGGVGSTTLAWALASIWSKTHKVLLWDFDPQMTLSMSICDPTLISNYEVLMGYNSVGDVITNALPEYDSKLKIIPASGMLARLDMEMAARFDRGSVVLDVVEKLSGFDLIVMDTPPSQGSILSIGPLAASNYVLLTCSCDDASFQQVPRFKQTVEMVQHRLQPQLKWLPIVANLYQQTQNMDRQVLQSLRENYQVFDTVIPKRISIREEMALRVPCTNTEMRTLAAEILEVIK